MSVTLTLTRTQLDQINNERKVQVDMLSDAQVNALAAKVNALVGLPFVSEEKEFRFIVKIIKWMDEQLYQLLPNEYYELIKDANDGISEEEAKEIERRLTPLINKVINIPIISEPLEAKLIGSILGFIINAMINGFHLEEKAIIEQ